MDTFPVLPALHLFIKCVIAFHDLSTANGHGDQK